MKRKRRVAKILSNNLISIWKIFKATTRQRFLNLKPGIEFNPFHTEFLHPHRQATASNWQFSEPSGISGGPYSSTLKLSPSDS